MVFHKILFLVIYSSLLNSYSLSHQSFADDTQLYGSSYPDQMNQKLVTISDCILDVNQLMTPASGNENFNLKKFQFDTWTNLNLKPVLEKFQFQMQVILNRETNQLQTLYDGKTP